MKRTLWLCLFSASVFSVGIAAGNHLRNVMRRVHSLPPASVLTWSASADMPIESFSDVPAHGVPTHGVPTDLVEADDDESAFLLRMRQALESADVVACLADHNSVSVDSRSTLTKSGVSISAERTPDSDDSVVDLVSEILPDLSPVQAKAWAGQLDDLSAEEAGFLLEQKRRVGTVGGLPVSLSEPIEEILNGPSASPSALADASETPAAPTRNTGSCVTPKQHPTLGQAMQVIRTNLLGAYVPGYRARRVILIPRSVQQYQDPSGGGPMGHLSAMAFGRSDAAFELVVQTRFECGPAAFSGNPLHVALPDDPQLMFQVTEVRVAEAVDSEQCDRDCRLLLTRRGDFSVLDGGFLGLRHGNGSFVLTPEIQITGDVNNCVILGNGEVQQFDADGQGWTIGRIPVVRVAALGSLESTDGLLFRPVTSGQVGPAVRQGLELKTESFELSNVDAASQWDALEHFQKLSAEPLLSTSP